MRQEGVVVLLELALVLLQVVLDQLLLDFQTVVAPVKCKVEGKYGIESNTSSSSNKQKVSLL